MEIKGNIGEKIRMAKQNINNTDSDHKNLVKKLVLGIIFLAFFLVAVVALVLIFLYLKKNNYCLASSNCEGNFECVSFKCICKKTELCSGTFFVFK